LFPFPPLVDDVVQAKELASLLFRFFYTEVGSGSDRGTLSLLFVIEKVLGGLFVLPLFFFHLELGKWSCFSFLLCRFFFLFLYRSNWIIRKAFPSSHPKNWWRSGRLGFLSLSADEDDVVVHFSSCLPGKLFMRKAVYFFFFPLLPPPFMQRN